ncbi:MAG TPA: transposase [Flavobacteriales bacterium]|nr:transposase [Flavobacteriales bacterium]
MSTYLSLHYHVVFSTKNRVPCLDRAWRERLFDYMGGSVRGLWGFPQSTGGWNDHVHLLFGLKATHCLSDVMRELKKASSIWVSDGIGLKTSPGRKGTRLSPWAIVSATSSRTTSLLKKNTTAGRLTWKRWDHC